MTIANIMLFQHYFFIQQRTNMISISFGIFVICVCSTVYALEDKEPNRYDLKLHQIVFVVLTQPNSFHVKRAQAFRDHFVAQISSLPKNQQPELYMTHETWDILRSWTLFPMLKDMSERFADKAWLFICEEETRIDIYKVLSVLRRYNYNENYFLGHELTDMRTIYSTPDLGGGISFSNSLFTQLGERFKNGWSSDDYNRLQFWSLGPMREFSRFLVFDKIRLTDVSEFCTTRSPEGCATWYPTAFPDCGEEIPNDELFVAVKTCEKFHQDRIPFVKATWGNTTSHIEYYSDLEDKSIPTIDLGAVKTLRGHCSKTMAILNRFHSHPDLSKYKWLLLADDDTIINLKRLRKLLACYNPTELVHLGERFGFKVQREETKGYNYITGGGGMIFSRPVITAMAENNAFTCSHSTQPDDMEVGSNLNRIDIPLTHSPYFHQYGIANYSQELLRPRLALSFHKHIGCDPFKTYNFLMEEPDIKQKDIVRDEL